MEELKEIQLLGEGAFGKCYLCIDPQDNTKLVVKQIDLSYMSLNEKKEAYHEAKIMSAFDHPNIIKFKDVYTTTNGKLNIVMDYADGGDLAEKIKAQKGKYFSENMILDIFVQLCLALKHVHDRKILHRDIKAQNVFLMKNGIVKLGDFGIAKVLNKTTDNAKTMVGTPYYLSPEIVDNKPYNFKSDVWSLGVLFYEMCTLKPPFDASSLHFLVLKIVRGAYPPLPPHYSRDLKTLIAQMLAIDPNKRPNIAQILKMPFINNRIHKLLTESIKKQEFSHTILHNQNVIENEEIRPVARPSGENQKKQKEEIKVKPKQKPVEKGKGQKVKEINITKEEKEKLREAKAKKREEDRIQMKKEILMKKAQKPSNEIVQWIGSNHEETRIIEELQEACKENDSVQEIMPLSTDENEEMIVRNDIIHSNSELNETAATTIDSKPIIPNKEDENLDKSPHGNMELLRFFLENKLGIDVFLTSYNLLKEFIRVGGDQWNYENICQDLRGLMNGEMAKEYLPLIHTLIFLENSSDSINI